VRRSRLTSFLTRPKIVDWGVRSRSIAAYPPMRCNSQRLGSQCTLRDVAVSWICPMCSGLTQHERRTRAFEPCETDYVSNTNSKPVLPRAGQFDSKQIHPRMARGCCASVRVSCGLARYSQLQLVQTDTYRQLRTRTLRTRTLVSVSEVPLTSPWARCASWQCHAPSHVQRTDPTFHTSVTRSLFAAGASIRL
jgi:hypothetical protein